MASASFNRKVSVCRSTSAKGTLPEEFAQEVISRQQEPSRDSSKIGKKVCRADSCNQPRLRPRSRCRSKGRRAADRGSRRRYPDSKQNEKKVANPPADLRHREPAFP